MARDGTSTRCVDLLDGPAVRQAVRDVHPDVIYHLAALSSVGRSWKDPAETMGENAVMAANLLEAIRHHAPAARVIWVSSCEVYGAADRLPIGEETPLRPGNPYAVSKAAGEMLAGLYVDAYGLDVVRARPFSHAGPEQRQAFLLSSLARQAAEGRFSRATAVTIVTGSADTRRDFTDVRDVVRAYRLLADRADGAARAGSNPAGVYNVSSGHSVSTAEHVELIAELLHPIRVEHIVDPDSVRSHEVKDLRGAHDRLTAATGWRPAIPLRQTLSDTISWWEAQLSRAGALPH